MERKRSIRRKQKPPFAQRAKDHCRAFTAFLFSNVGIIILVVLYMTAGAFMFIAIEGDFDDKRIPDVKATRRSLAEGLWNLSSSDVFTHNRSQYDEIVGRRIHDYQQTIVRAIKLGWQSDGKMKQQWTFPGAILYSLTVITTIGYGNVAPRTEWGKVATILYAIIGMPLFLLYLSNIGDILAKSFKWIYAKVCLCRICPGVAKRRALRERRKLRALSIGENYDQYDLDLENALESLSSLASSSSTQSPVDIHDSDDSDSADNFENVTSTVTVPITICLMIIIGYIIFGAIVFHGWEDWQPLDGCYFCFISLSSIGFGDFVPGDKIMRTTVGSSKGVESVQMPFFLCAIYLLLGMALIAMCFNLMQEQVIHKMRSFKRGIRRCFRCSH